MDGATTRRGLVRSGIGLAAAGSLLARAASATAAQSSSEARTLSYALQTERLAVIGYQQVLGSGVLSPSVRSQLEELLAQDRQHVSALEPILRRIGAALPAGPASVAEAQTMLNQHQIHRSLTKLPTQHDGLRVMIDIESLAEGAYFKAIPTLTDATVVRISASIMGSDAQHWTVLSYIQHHGDVTISVPYPFVQGSP
jgi:rubrerythrin